MTGFDSKRDAAADKQKEHMSKDEALKLALEALKWSRPSEGAEIAYSEAIAALVEALAQPAQEPEYAARAFWEKDGRIGMVVTIVRPNGGVHVLQKTIDPPQPAQLTEKEKISREMTAEIVAARALAQPAQKCWCTTCRPITMDDMRFVVCPDCGNKRCPKANDHRNACTNSNEVGQKGSSWEHVKPLAQPTQEPAEWSWVCNECGAHEFLSSVSESDLKFLSCGGCGCDEFHKENTASPQRPWVGLTDEDCKGMNAGDKVVAMWANRILKEKNT